jgi:lantibiotic modifying enzyme
MLLRLLQMLDGRDFHRENVIAHGEHPILVDLETLFHPILPVAAPAADDDETLPQSRGLRTGILPIPGNAGLRGRETELTVIGHTADLAWPFTSRGSSTAFEASEGLLAAPCVPVLDGCAVDPLPNRELFVDGYRQMDRTLRRVSRQLLEEGLLDRAADLPVRVVLRDTLTYAKVLTWSLQPDALSDGRSREARLEVLRRGHVGGDRLPAHVFQHEVDSLRDLDIPRFEVLPGEQDAIWRGASAEGDPPESTPLERVRNRLERAAGGSPDEDIKVIRSAFAMLEKRR